MMGALTWLGGLVRTVAVGIELFGLNASFLKNSQEADYNSRVLKVQKAFLKRTLDSGPGSANE